MPKDLDATVLPSLKRFRVRDRKLRRRNLQPGHESFGVMCEADAVHAVG